VYGVLSIKLIVGSMYWRSRPNPWVARITGLDPVYKLAREFQSPVFDYSRATRNGKNTYVYYFLPPGIYEVWYAISWKHETRYFIQVDESGVKHEIGREEVLECLQESIKINP
jgi:hypothetical protein